MPLNEAGWVVDLDARLVSPGFQVVDHDVAGEQLGMPVE